MKKITIASVFLIIVLSFDTHANSYDGPHGIEKHAWIKTEKKIFFKVGAGDKYNNAFDIPLKDDDEICYFGDIVNKEGERWYYCVLAGNMLWDNVIDGKGGWIRENNICFERKQK